MANSLERQDSFDKNWELVCPFCKKIVSPAKLICERHTPFGCSGSLECSGFSANDHYTEATNKSVLLINEDIKHRLGIYCSIYLKS